MEVQKQKRGVKSKSTQYNLGESCVQRNIAALIFIGRRLKTANKWTQFLVQVVRNQGKGKEYLNFLIGRIDNHGISSWFFKKAGKKTTLW